MNNRIPDNTHPLDRLLKPQSIALVGVSPRKGTVGNDMLQVLRGGGYSGQVYLVNPRYDDVDGLPCYPSLSALPTPVDMAVLSVAGPRIEALLDEAIALGVGGVTLFDHCKIEGETTSKLVERLQQKARSAGVAVCGGNCMGYYNFDASTHVSFQSPGRRKPGHIALVAHSGSIFVLPTSNDPRYRFNLVVSAGQEIATTLDEYMDFALEQPSTRVLAVFMEAVRNPAGFERVLDKARRRGIPVVVTRVGRTEVSARLAATHSGAIAGDNTAYEALFKQYGVICTESLDDLMNTALLLSQRAFPGDGDVGYVSDSGGLRELFVDTAAGVGLPFARLTPDSVARLAARLPHGLDPVNPLDAAGSFTPDYAAVFRDCVRYLMEDPNVALGVFEFEARDAFVYMPELIEVAKAVKTYSDKPFLVINSFAGALNSGIADDLMDHGVPLINGVEQAVRAIDKMLQLRDYRQRPRPETAGELCPDTLARWKARLAAGTTLSETDGLKLLADFGIAVAAPAEARDLRGALEAAQLAGYPVVLKTAEPGIHHKSDVDGVQLNLADSAAVKQAYLSLSKRLGPRVTVEPMIADGVELAFGLVTDPQFGPLVMVGSGGIHIEILKDRCFSRAPFDRLEARRMLDGLKIRPLLDGVRGRPACDVDALAGTLARFSELAAALADEIAEIDVNPLIVGERGGVAVDALVIGRPSASVDLAS